MSRIPVDTDEIRALAQILADTGLTEIEISEGDSRIRVARTPAAVTAYAAGAIAPTPVPMATPMPVAEPDNASHPGAIISPMVGVVYLSPEPGVANFVAPGQAVSAGQTLLLIEAMKTFNQIKAPRAGVVSRILVTSGVPVEFGEVLMVVE
jgi:acetyl-CoA carboxylase biotin carboxyl carrier protein